jgi:hypothetical protein
MAATETIRIVLHAQAASGLCFPYSSEVYDRPERSPPWFGVFYPGCIVSSHFRVMECHESFGRNICQGGPLP